MTAELPTAAAVPSDDGRPVDDAGFEAMRTDAVLTGRAMSSGQFLAGLLAAAELETAARPDRLPVDLFLGLDPVLVQEVWDRALAVGFHAGQLSMSSARFQDDELARVQGVFVEMGFHAMDGVAGRARGLVERARMVHPADGQIAREH